MSDRIYPSIELVAERLAYDHSPRSGGVIDGVEQSTAEKTNPHGAKVIAGDDAILDTATPAGPWIVRQRTTEDGGAPLVVRAGRRKPGDPARRSYAGKLLDSTRDLLVRSRARGRIITRVGQVQLECQDVGGRHTEVDLIEMTNAGDEHS